MCPRGSAPTSSLLPGEGRGEQPPSVRRGTGWVRGKASHRRCPCELDCGAQSGLPSSARLSVSLSQAGQRC